MKHRTPQQWYWLKVRALNRLKRRGGGILKGTRAERARAVNLFGEARRTFRAILDAEYRDMMGE